MTKLKKIKCSQCGATKFIQYSSNIIECMYCGTKMSQSNSIKDKFINEFKTDNIDSSTIKYLKTKVKEEEFYKMALIHLGFNKYSPSDIFDSKIGQVKCCYKYFAVIDVDFTAISINNADEWSNNLNILHRETVEYKLDKYMCISLSDGITNSQLEQVSNNIENLLELKNSVVTEPTNDNVPDMAIVQQRIENAIDDYTIQLKNNEVRSTKSDIITHNINEINIIAMPQYSLDYQYNGKTYTITSFATQLKLEGEIPKRSKEIQNYCSKKTRFLDYVTLIFAMVTITFACFHLINRKLGLIGIDISLIVITVVVYLVNILIKNALKKQKSEELFKIQFKKFELLLQKKAIKLMDKEKIYINKIMRWY